MVDYYYFYRVKSIIDRQAYTAFVQDHKASMPLFFYPMLLDGIYTSWEPMMILHQDEVVAVFILSSKKKFGFKICVTHNVIPYSGLWILPKCKQKYYEKIVKEIVLGLPKYHYHTFRLHHSINLHLPWKWAGYHQKLCYTYLIPSQQYQLVHKSYAKVLRSDLRYAGQRLSIVETKDLDILLPLFELSMRRSGGVWKVSRANMITLMQFGKAYIAVDQESNIQAAIMVVQDSHTRYNLFNGRIDGAVRGSVTLLLDHAIQEAMDDNKNFDFEGSSIEGVNQFFAQFGGALTGYHYLEKSRPSVLLPIIKLRY